MPQSGFINNYLKGNHSTKYSTELHKDREVVNEMKRILDKEEREVQVYKQDYMASQALLKS